MAKLKKAKLRLSKIDNFLRYLYVLINKFSQKKGPSHALYLNLNLLNFMGLITLKSQDQDLSESSTEGNDFWIQAISLGCIKQRMRLCDFFKVQILGISIRAESKIWGLTTGLSISAQAFTKMEPKIVPLIVCGLRNCLLKSQTPLSYCSLTLLVQKDSVHDLIFLESFEPDL